MSRPERAPLAEPRLHSPVEPHEVLVVGGGIAGIEALMTLADLGDDRLRVHVVAAHPTFLLRPQLLGEPWGGPPLHIDLEHLCGAFGASFTLGSVRAVDATARRVFTTAGAPLNYERLLLAPGAQLELPYRGTCVLGVDALPQALAADRASSVAIVVPAAASWSMPAYELALLSAGNGRDVRVMTAEAVALEVFGPGTHAAVASLLDRHGVRVETGSAPEIGADLHHLADAVIALPLLTGPRITGLAEDPGGFVRVDERMAVVGTDDVYAAGDAIDRPVKQGGLAGQQADAAAAEVVRSCAGDPPPEAYEPVLRGKLTAPDGEELFLRRALDGLGPGRASAAPLWQPPSIVCAWRLARWLFYRRDELGRYTLDHVARPLRANA